MHQANQEDPHKEQDARRPELLFFMCREVARKGDDAIGGHFGCALEIFFLIPIYNSVALSFKEPI